MSRHFKVVACLLVWLGGSLGAQTTASATPDHIVLAPGPTAVSRSIAWRSATEVTEGRVEWTEGQALVWPVSPHQLVATSAVLTTDLGDQRQFKAIFPDLTPGQTVTYRVGSPAGWSAPASFQVPQFNQPHLNFLVFGDSQSGANGDTDYTLWQMTLEAALQKLPHPDLIAITGDLVEAGGLQEHWDNWFTATGTTLASVPLVPVQGNHETFNPNGRSELPAAFIAQFAVPDTGPDGFRGQTWSFDAGPVHFAIVDSQEFEEAPLRGSILAPQAAWLDTDLAQTRQPWKIVFFHKPLYYTRSDRANNDVKAAFGPIMDRRRVDLVFNGHDHAYSRTWPVRADHFSEQPASGTVYLTTGRSGNKTYKDNGQAVWSANFLDPQAEPCFLQVDVDGQSLTISAFNQSGSSIDRFTINKTTNTIQPQPELPAKRDRPGLVVFGRLLEGQTPVQAGPEGFDEKGRTPKSFEPSIGKPGQTSTSSPLTGTVASEGQTQTTNNRLPQGQTSPSQPASPKGQTSPRHWLIDPPPFAKAVNGRALVDATTVRITIYKEIKDLPLHQGLVDTADLTTAFGFQVRWDTDRNWLMIDR